MKQFNTIRSVPYEFPSEAFSILKKNDMMQLPRFRKSSLKNSIIDSSKIIIDDLIKIGYEDVAVGRIYEGHINALLIIDRYGTESQKSQYFLDAEKGEIFGIWNTERSFEAMSYSFNEPHVVLQGAKTFCSGSLDVTRPIITARGSKGKQMIILQLEEYPELKEDRSLWHVTGMESTVSYRIDFNKIKVSKNQMIGQSGDYDREPMISTGAIRFAAVQFGCAKAIANIGLLHLQAQQRSENAFQNNRIAELGILQQTGELWFKGYSTFDSDEEHINYVNMLRTDILRICDAILNITEKAIGVQGFIKSHAFEKKYRDLKVYLKQPNPDLAFEKIGHFYNTYGYS